MKKLARNPAVLFSIALLPLVAVALIRFPWLPLRAATVPQTVSRAHLEPALIRAGIDPESLAASGITSVSVAGIVQAFESAMASEPHRLSQADAAYAQARVSSDSLRRAIESGQGTAGDVTAYQSAMQSLSTATAQREQALIAFQGGATNGWAGVQVTRLGRIRANRSWLLPVEFLVVDRSQADWVALRDALSNERIAVRLGEEPDPGQQALLATARSQPDVAQAKVSLDANLPAVRTAWSAAVAD